MQLPHPSSFHGNPAGSIGDAVAAKAPEAKRWPASDAAQATRGPAFDVSEATRRPAFDAIEPTRGSALDVADTPTAPAQRPAAPDSGTIEAQVAPTADAAWNAPKTSPAAPAGDFRATRLDDSAADLSVRAAGPHRRAAVSMRAVRLDGPGLAPRLTMLPVPRPRAGEVLLRVLAAGVCHTELQLLEGALDPGVWPLTPGHEIVGEAVDGPPSMVGRRFLVYYSRPCGECAWCREGQEQVCPNAGPQPGLSTDGGYAEFVAVPEECLVELPAELDPAAAAPLGCAAATAYHALNAVAQVQPGQTVVVYGIGGVGLALIQLATLRGARVLAIGRSPAKLGLARDLGATVIDAGAGSALVGGSGGPETSTAESDPPATLAIAPPAQKRHAQSDGFGRSGGPDASAADGDPVLAVRRLTRGEGADVVFELVGSSATMPSALAMLRRQGRLVFVGYGAARLRLNPLELVLRETRILSSLGNTRAELREVVRLAAAGALKMPLAGRFGLDDAAMVLDRLRRGDLAGRAVLLPGAPAGSALAAADASAGSAREAGGRIAHPASRGASHAPSQASHGASHEPSQASLGASHAPDKASHETSRQPADEEASHELAKASHAAEAVGAVERQAVSAVERQTVGAVERQAVGAVEGRPLERELLEFVGRGIDAPRDDNGFNQLALRLFAYQFANNEPLRRFCERRRRTPPNVRHWRDIPAIPIAAFKETLLAAEPVEGAFEFNSSGTTKPERKSRHLHPSLTLYDLNATLNFAAHVLPDLHEMRLLVLFPSRAELPHSSLAHWLSLMVERFGAPGSGHVVTNTDGLDAPRLVETLRSLRTDEPVGILAASFGLVHMLEYCQERHVQLALPAGSRVMDTGGYKGRSREYAKEELYAMVEQQLGVPPTHIVNMYGMTEHGTQFLDGVLRDYVRSSATANTGGADRSKGTARDTTDPSDTTHGAMDPSGTLREATDTGGAVRKATHTGGGAHRALDPGSTTRGQRYKVVPPWARTLVVDPETLVERAPGERGLLLHVDLINRTSAVAVLSEDVGVAVGAGFELLGRAQGAEARGCSIALDELLLAVKGVEQ